MTSSSDYCTLLVLDTKTKVIKLLKKCGQKEQIVDVEIINGSISVSMIEYTDDIFNQYEKRITELPYQELQDAMASIESDN